MDTLRSPRGCPWDRQQTPQTLRPFLLEETYEALDAIDRGDLDGLCGELGDVLFQCVFQSQIAVEAGRFEIADAVNAITEKLVRRHPHVFTPAGRPLTAAARRRREARTAGAVLEQWERIKAREQSDAGEKKRVLAGVPKSMPALLRAHEIGTRVGAVGFDWPNAADVVAKIEEEVRELRDALAESPARAAEELGDVLFSLANLARKLGLEPESALRIANDKFTTRFAALEGRFEAEGRSVHDASNDELEAAWARVKAPTPTAPASTSALARSGLRPGGRRSRR
jgi:nucleoside triphosphate diphosphatase